ncbi:hypothetical protein P3C38_27240 [Mesorhizobium sp. DSM 30133]|nr:MULTISPECIES: hypothetical protein [Mesorhizobium]MBZ9887464.1 hypothetical protein [Mesorhizobium sp. BR1-1-3]MDF3233429.1 hypothetical protein [Mesorhizobium sp. DSM 30133]
MPPLAIDALAKGRPTGQQTLNRLSSAQHGPRNCELRFQPGVLFLSHIVGRYEPFQRPQCLASRPSRLQHAIDNHLKAWLHGLLAVDGSVLIIVLSLGRIDHI